MNPARLLAALVLCAAGLTTTTEVRSGESYDNCTGFIDSVPATITTQGTWCLRQDVSTAITSGSAITIAANNVVLDCNDFKIGGLAAGIGSVANGVYSPGRQNLGVRNCGIRGFYRAVYVSGGAGHQIEDNRLDNNLTTGIFITAASNSVVRGNRVHGTGGVQDNGVRYGIYVYGGDAIEVTDNVVAEVVGTPGYYNDVVGIFRGNYIGNVDRTSAYIARNRVSGLMAAGVGKYAYGFRNVNYGGTDSQNLIENNYFSMAIPVAGSIGINCIYPGNALRGNTIMGFPTGFDGACSNAGGNVVY